MQTITPPQVQPIVEAIIDFYGSDFYRVSEFYNTILPQLSGTLPLTDAMLAALADWLADARFSKHTEPKLHGWQEVIDDSTGEKHSVNFDDIDWDRLHV